MSSRARLRPAAPSHCGAARPSGARRTALGIALAVALATGPAAAEPKPGELVNLPYQLNWLRDTGAYGGGFDATGQTLRFLRLPVSLDRHFEDRRWALRLRFEFGLGAYDFADFLDDFGLDTAQAITLLPGIGVPVQLGEGVVWMPYFDLGTGWVSDGGSWAFIARIGTQFELERFWGDFRLQARPRLEYVWSRAEGTALDDEFGTLALKFGARHPIPLAPRGVRMDAGAYGEIAYFFVPPELLDGTERVNWEFEVGVSTGTLEPLRLKFFDLPRLSVGYRFGENVEGLRVRLSGSF